MDRAAELRSLMKAKVSGGLTGKDKAKYLKSLREEKKEKPTEIKSVKPVVHVNLVKQPVVQLSSMNSGNNGKVESTATSTAGGPPAGFFDSVATGPPAGFFDDASAGPPAGFFDEPSSEIKSPATQADTSRMNVTYDFDSAPDLQPPPTKILRGNATEEYTEQLIVEAGANSDIPRGFFDDPLADLKARGVDIKKIEKKQEKREEEELKSFLGAIEEIQDGDVGTEQEEFDDEKERLIEEEMMQLNYERKLAVLLHQSDKVIDRVKKRALNVGYRNGTNGEVGDIEGEVGVGEKRKLADCQSDSNSSSSGSGKGSGRVKGKGKGSDNNIGHTITTSSLTTPEMANMIAEATKEGEAIFRNILGPTPIAPNDLEEGDETDILSKKKEKQSIVQISTSVDDVAKILRKKKAESKKLLNDSLSSDYSQLDFMDWTARSL